MVSLTIKVVAGAALLGGASLWALGSGLIGSEQNGSTVQSRLAPSPEVIAAARAGVATWEVEYPRSRITFESSVSGEPMTGSFGQWHAQIAFDPSRLADSRVAVTVDIASATTGDEARDELLPGPDWFDAPRFPQATFTAGAFKSLGGTRYEAAGELSIRGVKQAVVLPFDLTIQGDKAVMRAALTLDRKKFSLGQGQWQGDEVVPSRVRVTVALEAHRAALEDTPNAFGQAAAASVSGASCSYGPYWGDDYRPKPAFAGQTRAPAAPATRVKITDLAKLESAWSLTAMPDGKMLVTERPGRLRIVDQDGTLGPPITGLPPIKVIANLGLFDVALDPGFARNRILYFGYFAPTNSKDIEREADRARWTAWTHLPPAQRDNQRIGMQRIASARLSADGTRLENVRVLASQAGLDGRIVVGREGMLYVTAGTVASGDMDVDALPQQLNVTYGKVLRINRDGSIPADNPFAARKGASPEIFAYGLRDPQGAAINPQTGQLWTVEHGPRGGDELNIIRSGRNYGFPTIGYGRNYSGELINGGRTSESGMEQPLYFWTPSIAPSGMLFYSGKMFPQWQGNLFVGAMAGKRLIRLVLDGDKVTGEEQLLVDLCEPIREIEQGADGALYLLTKGPESRLLRLTPDTPR